ncbi:hypothetical protein GYO_1205 [Bacillus spizizenii TU-B-10]|uniref:Uncharacterized protein n=1 Tax=Bacillus spizizenii (strain DSM 15029 / JCM 12233 / NBRC 101239 / NRRL B-23049 / TU-B-10) TaxID=1052585 RepID=G4NUL5_BACS4|nr:hypothetical protein GYO_1205 [Bacillus spizizenii TU-B-10]SCV44385.1 hypothetical protein BQ1740_4066 [Bacillus subtilis]
MFRKAPRAYQTFHVRRDFYAACQEYLCSFGIVAADLTDPNRIPPFFSDQLYFVSVCRDLCRSLKGIICCLSK